MRRLTALLALSLIAAAPAIGAALKHPTGKSPPKQAYAADPDNEADPSGAKTDKREKPSTKKPEARVSEAKNSLAPNKDTARPASGGPDQAKPGDKSAAKANDTPNSDTKAAGGAKPVWEVKTVAPTAVEVAKTTYIVQPGDTLSAVVRKTGEGADVIAHDNHLEPPFTLRPGQKLKIAGGRYHTVLKGQSGIAIARAYQVEWSKIIELNHLQEPFTLREGQRLLLPPAQDVAKMSLEQRAAAFRIDLTDLATGSEPALAPAAKAAPPTPSPARQLAPTTPVAEPTTAFSGRFDWPVQGKIVRAYGPMDNGGRNDGITIAAPRGTAITVAADGVVMWVGEHPAFGNVVLVKHGNGWITIYGNADKLLVKRGQAVKIGQVIGRVGMTGSSAERPQVFFEVLQGKKPVNPMSLLPNRTPAAGMRDEEDTGPTQNGD
jgi:murein DD-endopeptidase MepM/ murein hydrolase activator NlpD